MYPVVSASAGSIPDSYDIYRYLNLVRYSILSLENPNFFIENPIFFSRKFESFSKTYEIRGGCP